jgi:hypothetical protein
MRQRLVIPFIRPSSFAGLDWRELPVILFWVFSEIFGESAYFAAPFAIRSLKL